VSAGKFYKTNEYGTEGYASFNQPGRIIPLGEMKTRGTGNTTVISSPQFNLAGAVITPELYADMERISKANAAQAGTAAYRQSMRDAPVAVRKAQRYGQGR